MSNESMRPKAGNPGAAPAPAKERDGLESAEKNAHRDQPGEMRDEAAAKERVEIRRDPSGAPTIKGLDP